jgi:acid phosphatase
MVKGIVASIQSYKLTRRQLFWWSGMGLAIGSHKFFNPSSQSSNAIAEALPSTPPLLRFVTVGDTGQENQGQYAVAKAMEAYAQSSPFPLALLLGDKIYENGRISKVDRVFEKPYRSLLEQNIPFYAALGNHDIRTNNGDDQLGYANFNMSGRYYTFVRDPVQFFALDTNTNANWPEQLAWLEDNLARSTAPWKVVFGHHPVYSSGAHGSNSKLGDRLLPLFSQYGVHLYICGHDHNYERSNPINGTTYVVCGAGATTQRVGRSSWTAVASAQLSFAAFEVYDDRIYVQAIGVDGQAFDVATF